MQAWLIPHQQLLSAQISQACLPHALIITGSAESGKTNLSSWFSQTLACQQTRFDSQAVLQPCQQCKHCQLFHAGSFPDLLRVHSDKASLGVDEIRHANGFIEKTAQLSGYKVVIIEAAETMTESAANALLKTLEEPSGNSCLILLTKDVQRLLPTVISRCRVLDLRPKLNYQGDVFVNHSHSGVENIHQDYNVLSQLFCQFILSSQHRAELIELLTANEQNILLLEKVIVDINRQFTGWQTSFDINLFQQLNQGKITSEHAYQWHKIFIQTQQHIVNLVQANKIFMLEKMLIEFQQLIRN